MLLLSIIGHIVLQYQHLGTFCCMQAALFMLVVGSVMCPLILEKTESLLCTNILTIRK